jgi:xylulokinase
MSLLGIDIGSSSCKGVVFGTSGEELAKATHAYSTEHPGPAMVEMNPEVFRDAVFAVIRTLSAQVLHDPVEALAISSHGETTIPVDSDGNPSGPAIMNSDNRAVEEAQWWDESFGREKIYAITGLPLHAMFSLNKIMWIKRHRPEIYNRSAKFLSVGDYVLTQLGMPPITDYSLASRTMAFDINCLNWSEEILNHCGIPSEKLATLAAAGTQVGRLSKEKASDLGLKEGTVVALGGHDQPCGALGAGAVQAGDVFDSAGTYECMAAVSDKPLNNSKALGYSLNSYCHVVPGKFVTLAFFPAGLVSSWFVDQFCYEDKMISRQSNTDLFDVLAENTSRNCPGPSGLNITPHFVGSCNPYWDVRATGVMAGFTPGTTRYHIYKGIYEGIACELSINADVLQEIAGDFKSMNISGGNARSLFSVQLRADISGKEIGILKNNEAVCLGVAILAGISTRVYRDAGDAVKKIVQVEQTIVPDAKVNAEYGQQKERYKILYPSLQPYRGL